MGLQRYRDYPKVLAPARPRTLSLAEARALAAATAPRTAPARTAPSTPARSTAPAAPRRAPGKAAVTEITEARHREHLAGRRPLADGIYSVRDARGHQTSLACIGQAACPATVKARLSNRSAVDSTAWQFGTVVR